MSEPFIIVNHQKEKKKKSYVRLNLGQFGRERALRLVNDKD